MPIIGVPLNPGNTGAKVGELHVQLQALGAVIASGEQTGKSYGPSTVAAVSAFRQRYDLPAGDTMDLPTGRLMHVASAFAGTGVAWPCAPPLAAAAAADASQPQELYWLARYATLAGEYQTAHDIALRIPGRGGITDVIGPILTLPTAPVLRPPEGPYPENFYTYRYDLVPRGLLDDMLLTASGATLRMRRRLLDRIVKTTSRTICRSRSRIHRMIRIRQPRSSRLPAVGNGRRRLNIKREPNWGCLTPVSISTIKWTLHRSPPRVAPVVLPARATRAHGAPRQRPGP